MSLAFWCMQNCGLQAAADTARHCVRQLRGDGELEITVTLQLLARVLTRARADCGVLRERYWGRDHALAVETNGGG